MNPTKRRFLSSVLSGLILVSMLFSLIAPLGSFQTVDAQEVTDEPPVESTDTTDPLAGSPTPEATAESTASSNVPPVIPVQPTSTEDAPVIIGSPAPVTTYMDDFQDGDTEGWSLSEGWALTSDPANGNIFLVTEGAFETATIPGLLWDNVAVSSRIGLTPGNTANIAVRVGADNYNVTFRADGTVRLFQGMTLLSETAALEVIEANDLVPRWYDVSVQAVGNTLTISLNGAVVMTTTVETVLPAGAIVFSSGVNNTGRIMLDDVNLQQVASAPPVTPTETNEAPVVVVPLQSETPIATETTPEVTAEATDVVVEPTAEATVEVTEEVTAEVTPEATVEMTPDAEGTEEAEATAEVTPEVTAEATPEATEEPEIPLEPVAFSDFDGEISGWSLSEGTTIYPTESGYALSMGAGAVISPQPVIFLGDFRADARVSIEAPVEGETAGGLDVNFHINGDSAYRLAFGLAEVALYDGETLLTSVPVTLSADTWYALSLTVEGGHIVLTVDDVEILTLTLESDTSAGEISFGATGALLIDDIAIYDLGEAGDGAETAVPFTLTEDNMVKVGRALYGVLNQFVESGEETAVAAAQEYFMTLDEANRVRVEIWGVEGFSLSDLSEIVASTNSVVINTDVDHVNAYASFEALIDLTNRDEIAAITLPAIAVSTSLDSLPADEGGITQQALGDAINPHSLDIIGANIWHEAGVYGNGVVVGVIDTSFAGASITSERVCLASATPVTFAGDVGDPGTAHGLNVVEVICDIAPQSAIVMYRASSVGVIDDAINRAVTDQVDLIVITIDSGLGGTVGGIDAAITGAYEANIPVIASAGNTGESGGRAFGFGGETGTVTVRASAGSIIDYSWTEPNGQTNYPSTLSMNGEVIDSREVRAGGSVQQYVVPESCGESCSLDLQISGDQNTTIQVQATGGSDTTITDSNMTRLNTPDTLTTAANSPNAIAVGAVCASQSQGYPILDSSSAGPPVGSPSGSTIKPEVVAPSFVRTSLSATDIECSAGGGVGFGGTSAAAAHVAGMAALLFTEGNTVNPALDAHFNSSFQKPQRLELYLMGHSIELHEGATPDGFDNVYGAGLTVLGSPFYNINQRVNYSSFANPDGLSALDTEAYYVGNADLFSTQDGSPSNPFFHIETAVQAAIANNRPYVILQPGEYAGGFVLPDPSGTNSLTLSSFDAADIVSRFGSSIVVTDVGNIGDGGGIYINNAQNIAVQGIDFTGSSPLYLTNATALQVLPPTPIFVRGSTGITIQQNTFSYFDQPLQVIDSDAVEILNNSFTEFDIRFDNLAGDIVPFFNSAALNIQGPSTVANQFSVLVEGNSFTNNFIAHNQDAARFEPIIRVVRMEADLFNNRFVDNTAGSVVMIDQWATISAFPPYDRSTQEVVIYSSLFVNNTLAGPIIHLYQGQNFQFVNNSVINHTLEGNPLQDSVIAVGQDGSEFQQFADHRFNIINNLFFNNNLFGELITMSDGDVNIGCAAIGSPANAENGARNNWFIDRFGETSGFGPKAGFCTGSVEDPANNNLFGTNASPTIGGGTFLDVSDPGQAQTITDFANATFFLDYDEENPYRLLPYDIRSNPNPPPTTPPEGVDVGNNAAVNSILGYNIQTPPVDIIPLDVMGLPRLIDRTNLTPATGDDIIDIGAYELSNPEPVSFLDDDGTLTPTTSEDVDAVTFSVLGRVTGGFQPYTFNFSNLPVIYDPDPQNPCEGLPIKYDEITKEVTYCPPNDFHTSGAGTPQITFNYTATGLLDTGTTPQGTINVVIQPTNDGVPVSNTDTQVIFTDLSTQVNYRLRPYVEFSPEFNLSDPDDDDSAGTPSDVDYPFTFSNFAVDEGATGHEPLLFGLGSNPGASAMNSAIAAAVQNGVFNFTPAPGISGAIEFTYRVTDRDGQTANDRRVRLVVTTRLAGPGLHDDASLDFVYQNGWLPYYYEPAINNTWHYTTTESSVDFYFIGDAFGIHVFGHPTGGNMEIELDPDDIGTLQPQNYSTYSELQCSNPDKPAIVSTATALSKNFVYGCTGVESIPGARDQLHRLRITNVTPNLILVIDAISVRDEGLPPGLYQDNDFMVSHSPLYNAANNPTGWLVGATAPVPAIGESYSFTAAQNATMSFNVDGDLVDTMVIYRTMGPGFGAFDVYVNGARRSTVQSNAAAVAYAQAAVITGIGSGVQTVEIRNLSPSYIIVEGIELLAAESPLVEGSYAAEDGRISYVGAWADYADPNLNDGSNPSEGTLRYSVDANAVAVFRINGSGVTINRTTATGWGQIEVCIGLFTCKVFSSSTNALVWGQPSTVRSSISGIQTVTVRSLDAGPIGIDSVEVIGTVEGLEPGYYEENDPTLAYSGGWTPYTDALALGGSMTYTLDPNAVLSFPINPSLMESLVVYYPGGAAWGTMRVCNGTACQTINQASAAASYNNFVEINKAVFGLSSETLATITIQPVSGYIGIEAIQILSEPGPLAPGYYEETRISTSYNLTYTAGWATYTAVGPRGYTMRYTNQTSQNATFMVVPNDIDGVVIYHTGGPGYGGMQVCRNTNDNCQTIPNASSGVATFANRTFISKAALNLPASDSPSTITIRPQTNGLYIGLEALHIVAANPDTDQPNFGELATGVNMPDSNEILFVGPWIGYQDAVNIPSGEWNYTSDPAAATYFVADGTGLVINHGVSTTGYTPFEVCVDGNECTVFSSTSDVFQWDVPSVVWFNSAGVHNVEIRSLGGGTLALESIEVLNSARPVLQVGNTVEDTDPALQYNGQWARWNLASLIGGNGRYTNMPSSTLTLRVNPTDVDEIAVFHPRGASWGTMQICRNSNDSCQPITLSSAVEAYNVATRISTGAGGLNLGGGTQTITIRQVSGFVAVEAIQLVADGVLTPGYYEETPQSTGFNLDYTPNWLAYSAVGPRGGSMRYTNSASEEATFSVIPDNISGIVIYHTGGPGYGGMNVCNGGNCETIANASPAVATFGNRTFIPKAELNLTGGSATEISISPETNGLYIGLEAIQIMGAGSSLPLLPDGLNSSGSANLKYVGSWATYNALPPIGPLEGVLSYSTDPSGAVLFRINGDGVAIYRYLTAGWGNFEVCIDGTQCETFTNNDVLSVWGQPITVRADTGVGEHVVEIRSLDALIIGIEAIEVLDPPATLSAGLYQESDPDLTYTNVTSPSLSDWTNWYAAGLVGNSAKYTNDPADELSFSVNANTTEQIAIYYPGGPGWGMMRACNATESSCVMLNQAAVPTALGYQWVINIGNGANELDITGTNAQVVINSTGGYIGIEAVEVRGDVGPLTPGIYQQDNFNLTYTGTWVNLPGAYWEGDSIYTATPNSQMTFQITDATGFSVVVSRFAAGVSATMRVCYTRQSNNDTNCVGGNDGVVSTVSNTGLQQDFYLYSYYGLPSRNVSNSGPETYTVTVTFVSPASPVTYLVVDAIIVYDEHDGTMMTSTTPGTPNGQPILYDATSEYVTYGPSGFWTSGVAAGYIGSTYTYSTLAGTIAEAEIEGNSVTIYQLAGPSSTRDARFCLVQAGGSLANNLQCTSFSQNAPASVVQSPITLYGFGYDQHKVVFENRDYGYYFLIDGLEVR